MTATSETLELVLQQARGFGVSTVLAHQSLGDLRKPSGDLTKTVLNNTRLRICFGAADPDDIDTLVRCSGEAAYETLGWTQPTGEAIAGRTGPERAAGEHVSVGQTVAARVRKNDILRMNNAPDLAWAQVVRGAGYSQFGGEPLIVRMPHYVSRVEHESRQAAGWPSAAGTFVAAGVVTERDQLEACCSVYDGAVAWVLRDIRPITPFPVRGQLGLFEVELPAEGRGQSPAGGTG